LLTDLSGFSGPALADGGRDSAVEGQGPGDAASETETAPPIDAGRCDPSKAFGAPVALEALNLPTENDRAARLTPDELTIYFSSDRSNELRVYRATRAKVDDAFGPPVLLSELATAPIAFRAAVPSTDGLELIVETRVTDGGSGRSDLARATRASQADSFGPLANIAGLSGTADDTDPNLTAGDLELWLSMSPGASAYDIFVASRASRTEPFGPPVKLPGEVNGATTPESDPVPSADGTELFFQTNREGGPRIWVAHRASRSESFGAPTHVTELDGPGTNDVPNWLSPDRCTLYMTSIDASNIAKLYVAKRGR
jgi:Tol biopolymer transport system component